MQPIPYRIIRTKFIPSPTGLAPPMIGHARPKMVEILVAIVKLVRASNFPGGACMPSLQTPYTVLTDTGICPHHPCLVSLYQQ